MFGANRMFGASLVCAILSMATLTARGSTVSDPHYVAAVLEYSFESTTELNLNNYIEYIREAAQQDADIVVFPEMTLLRGGDIMQIPFYSLLKEYPSPALRPDLYHNALVQLSQAAIDNAIYVVVNVPEELNCTSPQPDEEECPDSDVYRFNTDVVFDRNGSVIDRYRKINLFGEYSRTPAFSAQPGVFSTDFGVTFGHFICFDLMFQVPAIQLVQKYNLTDIIFPTMWFSEMPFLTAVEIQEAYAYANNVNFLASGANRVSVGSAGSGIYSGKAGALISIMPGVETRRMLVSKVPKIPGQVEGIEYPGAIPNDPKVLDGLYLKRDQSLPAHVTRVLEQTEQVQQFQLTDGDVTCSFTIQLKDLNNTGSQDFFRYRAYAQGGAVTYAHRQMGVSACAVVACVNDDVTSCAQRSLNTISKYEFTTLRIIQTATQPKHNNKLDCKDGAFFPTTLKQDKYPVDAGKINFTTGKDANNSIYHDESEHRMSNVLELNGAEKDILTFGIWGRIYDKDVDRTSVVTEDEKRRFQAFEDEVFST